MAVETAVGFLPTPLKPIVPVVNGLVVGPQDWERVIGGISFITSPLPIVTSDIALYYYQSQPSVLYTKTDQFLGNGSRTAFTAHNTIDSGTLVVYLNGLRQVPTSDYSLGGSIVVFGAAPYVGDEVLMIYETGSSESGTTDIFSGDGSTQSFTLSGTINNDFPRFITLGCVVKLPNEFSISGNIVTFLTAPDNGISIYVDYIPT